jgi:hypothetical protein
MARTFIQQETQIRNTPAAEYADNIAPTLANYQTNPTNLQQDLNNIRSQVHNLLETISVGNWYDPLNTPSTFEFGAQRGVNDLNTDLHDLERKRVLVTVSSLIDVVVPASVQATNTFTSTGAFSTTETITIGGQVYTFVSPFVDVAGNIDASGTTAQTHQNLRRAINGNGVAGVNYGTGTPVNTSVTATDGATSNVFTAILGGTAGNLIATTTTCANATVPATLTGGTGDISILTLGQLPSNTTQAVGAVTTLGTVAAFNATFGSISLAEVAGSTAISPKNLCEIVDGSTRDPILSSGRTIYALFQVETVTDGITMTGTTPNRAQLSYVRLTSTGDDLEMVPASDIAGKTINYSSVERKGLDSLSEQDFLRGAIIDVPAGTTVTRQIGYDNQGTTPVTVLTNSLLDLGTASVDWEIRDLASVMLFKVLEGSTGGTSEVQVGAATDLFKSNAVLNEFNTGAAFDNAAAGTTINVGVTANQIDAGGALTVTSGGAADLNLVGALELNLTDSYRAGSTWSLAAGVALSSASAEWSLFETNFGEVSLLNAINQAYASAAGPTRGTKTYSNVTVTSVAGTDMSLATATLDAALPDMSQGTFTDHDVYLNGNLLRGEASYPGANDYGPGTVLNPARLKFEFITKVGDVICVVPWNP